MDTLTLEGALQKVKTAIANGAQRIGWSDVACLIELNRLEVHDVLVARAGRFLANNLPANKQIPVRDVQVLIKEVERSINDPVLASVMHKSRAKTLADAVAQEKRSLGLASHLGQSEDPEIEAAVETAEASFEPPAAEPELEEPADEPVNYSTWSRDRIKGELNERGIEFRNNSPTTQLIAALEADDAAEAPADTEAEMDEDEDDQAFEDPEMSDFDDDEVEEPEMER